jgi:integral membrane protein (TIGR01906 family)
MDYCLGLVDNFELTHLTWSAEGAAHFADVRGLFILDLVITGASILILGMLWSVGRYTKVKPARIKGHGPGFWAATNLGVAFAVLGVLAAMDFDRFFTAFHKVFFPGKENWIFDPDTDPVIEMLPQTFFRNCGMLVLGLILGCCIILMLHDMGTRHSNERK